MLSIYIFVEYLERYLYNTKWDQLQYQGKETYFTLLNNYQQPIVVKIIPLLGYLPLQTSMYLCTPSTFYSNSCTKSQFYVMKKCFHWSLNLLKNPLVSFSCCIEPQQNWPSRWYLFLVYSLPSYPPISVHLPIEVCLYAIYSMLVLMSIMLWYRGI